MRLLYIEDDPDDVVLLEEALESAAGEWEVESVDSFYQGFERLAVDPRDVVLLDLGLPDCFGMDGLRELCDTFPDLPVIVLTGQDDAQTGLRAIHQGAQDYLVKGLFTDEVLMRALRYAVERKKTGRALDASERLWRKTFSSIADSLFILDITGHITQYNKVFIEFVGKPEIEILGKRCCELIHNSPDPIHDCPFERMKKSRKREQYVIQKQDRWWEITVDPILDKSGELLGGVHVMKDISEDLAHQDQQILTAQVLETLNNSRGKPDVIEDILQSIQKIMGFDAVGIRLKEGEDYPYYKTNGFSDQFVRSEKYLCTDTEFGEIQRDSSGNPVLECLCGDVICRRFNPKKEFFTEGGSFWTNSTTKLLDETSEADRDARMLNRCRGEGYESVALIPLQNAQQTIGLLQLNHQKKDRFTLELIQYFEGLGYSIGIALARKETDEKIRESLKEKVVLLKEIHHRVKNNLQIILSLLNLQMRRLDDTESLAILRNSKDRIHSMSLVHEKLYQSENLASIGFRSYIQTLTNNLIRSYSTEDRIQVKYEVEDVQLGIETAVPCALIINEIFTNALKHAFPESRAGNVSINLQREEKKNLRLIIADDGVGLPRDFVHDGSKSLGMRLVHILVEQLHGEFEIKNNNGTQCVILFEEIST